jgi:mannose-6-phosphate isomerase-like protein (cupin superfamily)
MGPQPKEERPWGYFVVLVDDEQHKLKRIVVNPGKRLSLQRHRLRDEHWMIVSGEALMTVDSREFTLLRGQSVDIPRGALHRVMNPGETELVIVEIQTGDSFDENDIERFEDDFGRA